MDQARALGNIEQRPATRIDVGEMRSYTDHDVRNAGRLITVAGAARPMQPTERRCFPERRLLPVDVVATGMRLLPRIPAARPCTGVYGYRYRPPPAAATLPPRWHCILDPSGSGAGGCHCVHESGQAACPSISVFWISNGIEYDRPGIAPKCGMGGAQKHVEHIVRCVTMNDFLVMG